MASAMYPSAKKALLDGGINLLTADVRAVLIDSADETYNAADDFLDDITAIGMVGTAVALTSKDTTGGVFDAADVTFTAVTGDPVEAVLLYIHTGTASTARLIAIIDLPASVTPVGGDITVQWSNGANKIFALT